ncbi:glycosyltransferase [Pseudomonas schmalbachii]|uniref:Glycosyltransferase n=1 Tax=Pseudomonas schmalbachii TaxID=2816993 RepID=A0ABS3TU65_9PSED|nr:glycosyltransferase [Pseudomonas schmalbachii]MBO3276225.1 glycosyltransferase [Pseudomonas schmalbachii]
MSLKYYGIYLAYAPTVDLRGEGLGRYLASFLKGAARQPEVRFVLVCPSWSRKSLQALFEEEQVPPDTFELISPKGIPPILHCYEVWDRFRKRSLRKSRLRRLAERAKEWKATFLEKTLHQIAGAQSFPVLALKLIPLGLLGLLGILFSPLLFAAAAIYATKVSSRRLVERLTQPLKRMRRRIQKLSHQPKDDGLAVRMYREMENVEARRMQEMINTQSHVRAWYCPTAFWPEFNKIKAPRLVCVPDVVMSDFAVGFSTIGPDRMLKVFQDVGKTIEGGDRFVTYSESVKWETLVDRYAVAPSRVSVVNHAPNDLTRWVSVTGFNDNVSTSRTYCRRLLETALRRTLKTPYGAGFLNSDFKFFFYASQIRPNKNVLTLLRAYEYLLHRKLIGHKLILTGHAAASPEVSTFVLEHRLEKEVLFLHGLKTSELAACYALSDLAVNPSLSEGGCPFTFTEALSVNTPVVMARIPVTEEVLTEPELQEVTFFDPYDWKDLAGRIEWAIEHRDELLAIQQRTYMQLSKRSWTDVVDEHLQILENMSQERNQVVSL